MANTDQNWTINVDQHILCGDITLQYRREIALMTDSPQCFKGNRRYSLKQGYFEKLLEKYKVIKRLTDAKLKNCLYKIYAKEK